MTCSSPKKTKRRARSYALGVKGCADEVISRKLSRITGWDHDFFELDTKYLSEFLPNLREMIKLTDGMYLTHGLTEMLALGFLGEENGDVLLRGHGGELAKMSLGWPLHTDADIRAMRGTDALIPHLLARLNYISEEDILSKLFTPVW